MPYNINRGETMSITTAQIAAADQAEAREREFDRKAFRVAAVGMTIFALLAVYSILAALGYLPAAPWSALGK